MSWRLEVVMVEVYYRICITGINTLIYIMHARVPCVMKGCRYGGLTESEQGRKGQIHGSLWDTK